MSEHYRFGIREIRQNVHDSVYELFNDDNLANMVYCRIMGSLEDFLYEKEQEQENEWIPVSERLPEYYVCVLTWDGSTYNVEQRIPSIRGEDGEPIQGEWWVDSYYDEYESDVYTGLREGTAIAWMPLPEPYEKENERDV